ncbi:C-C motif chemokine 19-like [Protopterus annectens]|uniref:C-C motif chemokine 19-like n=1 Tax=Protopterus annectens TaxID=7888 RepID=UPI001CFA3433|nr:C-C motif chemokine 19-like [Protopterus annectens]
MMSLKTVSLVIFISILLLWTHCQAAGTGNIAVDCCLDVSQAKIPVHIIKDFHLQTTDNGCQIPAVVFITKKNRQLCAPDKSSWVLELMRKVKRNCQKQKKPCQALKKQA